MAFENETIPKQISEERKKALIATLIENDFGSKKPISQNEVLAKARKLYEVYHGGSIPNN